MPQTVHTSHAGGRPDNQDAWGHCKAESFELWAVADGLGGHGGGEIASKIAVDALVEAFRTEPSLEQFETYFSACQEALLQHQKAHPETADMRTTLSFCVSDGEQVRFAHSGDTRIYWISNHQIRRSLDHSIPQLLVQSGEIQPYEIRQHQDRNRIVRALGNPQFLRHTISECHQISENSTLLIVTDGFWEYVNGLEVYVARQKNTDPQQWLAEMTAKLLVRAPKDHDNYTAIGVWFD